MQLVSPGVSVTVIDQSFYIPGQATTVPLIFLATADHKTNPDGEPAIGTYESNVLRTVTTVQQSLELYGTPIFKEGPNGEPFHGDARNEYGLDALNKYLDIGNRAYVVRANVNLNDDLEAIKTLWLSEVEDSAEFLSQLVSDYIDEFNAVNGYVPTDVDFKETVTAVELKELVSDALETVLGMYSFSSVEFETFFLQDKTIDQPGFHDVIYDSTQGIIQSTDSTGLANDTTEYAFELDITDTGGTFNNLLITVTGQNAQTFGELIEEIETDIQAQTSGSSTVTLVQGRVRITSDLDGVTSYVEVVSDGFSGYLPLFASTNLYDSLDTPVAGTGPNPLDIYNDSYDTIVIAGGYDGLDALIDNWTSGAVVGKSDEFTGQEAEGLLVSASIDFSRTKEFKNTTSLGANDAAKRAEIVQQLQAAINAPGIFRTDRLEYNVVVCPGYPETAQELVTLSEAMRSEVFVIGETPFDKPPTGPNSIAEWSTTQARVYNRLIAYWYPHGLSSNLDGATILTTAASTALRTIAFNDREAEVFFAPAGTQRGTCPHLESVGYVSGTLGGPTTFVEDDIDQGTRDELYEFPRAINPITFIPGRGILVFGQKTSQGAASALDRINVMRLIILIRREIRKALFPFLFEPNDQITRDNVKFTVDSYLAQFIERRGLYDFASICDSSNNTPDRIDRNELWVDIALKPVKAVEFIYVPIRIVNTGADIGGRDIDIGA